MEVNRDNNEVMGGGIEVLGAYRRSMGGLWGSIRVDGGAMGVYGELLGGSTGASGGL